MNKSPQLKAPNEVTDADVALDAEERAAVRARAVRPALEMGVIGTCVWYLIWFLTPNSFSIWTGLLAFPAAVALGYGVARLMLQRQVNAILLRRKNLVRHARELKKAQAKTQATQPMERT